MVATCIGFTAVVLFGRAGEPVRPYLIARKEGVSFSSQVAAWVVERILDLLMILIIFGVALTRVSHSAIQSSPRIELILQAGGAAAGVTGLACLVLLVGLRQFRGEVQHRLLDGLAFLPKALLARIATFLAAFGEGMQSTRSAAFTLPSGALHGSRMGTDRRLLLLCLPGVSRHRGSGIHRFVIVLGFVASAAWCRFPASEEACKS